MGPSPRSLGTATPAVHLQTTPSGASNTPPATRATLARTLTPKSPRVGGPVAPAVTGLGNDPASRGIYSRESVGLSLLPLRAANVYFVTSSSGSLPAPMEITDLRVWVSYPAQDPPRSPIKLLSQRGLLGFRALAAHCGK